jgi:hypothetical protein
MAPADTAKPPPKRLDHFFLQTEHVFPSLLHALQESQFLQALQVPVVLHVAQWPGF